MFYARRRIHTNVFQYKRKILWANVIKKTKAEHVFCVHIQSLCLGAVLVSGNFGKEFTARQHFACRQQQTFLIYIIYLHANMRTNLDIHIHLGIIR